MEERRRSKELPSQKGWDTPSGRQGSGIGGSLLLLPFKLVWGLLTFILGVGGRLITIILGLVLIVVGLVVTILSGGVLGVCGVPIALFGGLTVLRSLFR